ncbi:U3 small nucleolar ribonucleoprotein protein MPP10-like [Lineus longissimus]|uniref:U3 small nucleolar ribonucleoprotein protein MPP10-like n=1 Tax=Lineus longissimus TaxID=88925 RepID=UPI002B4F23AF
MAATTKSKNLVVENIFKEFDKFTEKPEVFLGDQKDLSEKIKKTVKYSYDFLKQIEEDSQVNEALPELIIKDFDDEQIWQELELQNDPTIDKFVKNISTFLTGKSKSLLTFLEPAETEEAELVSDSQSEDDYSDSEKIDSSDGDISDSELKSGEKHGANAVIDWDDEDSEGDMGDFGLEPEEGEVEETDEGEEEDSETRQSKSSQNRQKKSEVDDGFFSLAAMAEFLDQEDAREEKSRRQSKSREDEDEEGIDLFTVKEEDEEGGLDVNYDDFFDPVNEGFNIKKSAKQKTALDEDSGSDENEEDDDGEEEEDSDEVETEEEENSVRKSAKKSGKKQLMSDSESEGEDLQDILGHKESKSTFEKRQERLKSKIKDMEEASLAAKPWQLMGEAAGGTRPENSLLQEDLQFEHTGTTAPVITEETTQTLEEMIKQRIKDKAWDDVERKVRKKEEVFEYKKRITLDHEKSKASLGEIYEKEFLKQTEEEKEAVVDPAYEDIRKTMQSLFIKLDALSNFHYTPKPSVPDVKIISNLPSINMEEVAPVSVSEVAMMAPEEIKDKSKAPEKGVTEKTATDRNRERKNKKAEKRKKRAEKERRQKMVEKLNPGLGNKYSKENAMKDLDKLSKSGGQVTVIKDKNSKAPRSSKAFFSQLQDEVKTQVHSKKAAKKRKGSENEKSSAKFKL